MVDVTRPVGAPNWIDRTAGLALLITVLMSGFGLVAGAAAALVGGPLTPLGGGLGGLYGIPFLVYTVAVVLGLPSLFADASALVRGRWAELGRSLGFIGPLVVYVAYFFVSHALDPCANGWSALGVPCERFDADLNVATRYHLLHHAAVPTVLVVGAYVLAARRWRPPLLRYLAVRPRRLAL